MKKKFYFLSVCLFLSVVSFAQSTGPVVYLPLDTDLTDASGNGYNAVDSGKVATVFVSDAERGQVAFFDTMAHAALPNVDALKFGTGDFSYAMWLKIDRIGGDPAILGNKDWNSGRNTGFVMYVKKANEVGAPNCSVNFSDGTSKQPDGNVVRLYWEAFANGAPDIIDGTWHFFAASFDRDDTLRVWVDGEQQYSVVNLAVAQGMANDTVHNYPIRIMEDGTGTYNNGSGLKGYMDELRIWNRTITDAEVKALYSPAAEGPVVYLPLDTDLTDASGNGYNAVDSGKVATVFVNDAERGQVAFFDTMAHAALPNVDALKFGTGDFSYAMWLKIDRIGGDPAIFGNKDWNSGRNTGFVMYVKKANEVGAPNCTVNFSDGTSKQPDGNVVRLYWEAFANGAPDIIDGTWHFFAASFDRDDTLRVWVDGEQQYSVVNLAVAQGMANDTVHNYPIRIMEDGTGTYNNGSGLKGYMDELRIWNRTITDAEVKAIYAPEEEAEGPVVYLPLDTDLKDASGNGLDATDGGVIATTFVNDAVRGQVAFFDTACHAVLPKVDTLRFGPGQDFAFSMWMKIDRLGGDPAILGNKDWNNGRNKGFVMYNVKSNEVGAKNLGINFSDGPSDQGGSHNRLYWETFPNGAPDMIDGTWHFIAASFDRDDTLRVWVDGELQYSVIDMSIAPGYAYDNVNDYPIRIMEDGTGTYNKGSGMKGYIDEVRIWNRVVTDDEIKALYDQTNTAIAEIEEAALNTTLYPNPSNGAVNIRFNAKNAGVAQVQVFNSTGAMITGFTHSTIAGQNLATFNVNGWNQGFYFVRVISDSTSETVRLVVAR